MATIAERDVLLEGATLGYLVVGKLNEPGIKEDVVKMNALWEEIFDKYPQEIDMKQYVKKIKELKRKYER